MEKNIGSSISGFTIAEVMISLVIVTLAIVLVGALSNQVINLSNRSKQTSALIEIKSMTNSITRSPESWLNKMRSSIFTNGIYAGCIPDPKVNLSVFSCPVISDSLVENDEELKKISGDASFHLSSAPILDNAGELIAGTVNDPVYLSNEGRKCDSSDHNQCPLVSVGFFLRSNPNSDQDPGSIKFVIKVYRNSQNLQSASSPMKPQYLTLDIGEEWKSSTNLSGGCPSGTIKTGYLSNGNPNCVSTAYSCSGEQLPIGLDSSGSTICRSLPDCTSRGGGVVLNAEGDDLVCSSNAPCGANKLFLGYFAGSGEPMCSSSEMKCADGQVQTGISISNGDMVADCASLPHCTEANQRLSFDGTRFQCESVSEAPGSLSQQACPPAQLMYGINSDGSPMCKPIALILPKCPNPDDVMQGFNPDGTPICKKLNCPANTYLTGFSRTGELDCQPVNAGARTCPCVGTRTQGQCSATMTYSSMIGPEGASCSFRANDRNEPSNDGDCAFSGTYRCQ